MKLLKKWKGSNRRQPLIIKGARQVGKTWIMREFGRKNYDNVAYISLDDVQTYSHLFSDITDPERIVDLLRAELQMPIHKLQTLIIFDEIQEIPNALNCLKYFYEKAPEYHIIAGGSTLGVLIHQHKSFPVGKVTFLDLQPLSFFEFLDAIGENRLRKLIKFNNLDNLKMFHNKLILYLKQYMYVGGMPECVLEFIESRDYNEVRSIQEKLLTSYYHDFEKYAPISFASKLRMIWDSVPSQLSKENKKFIYGAIKSGARALDFEAQIQWLQDSSLMHKVPRISKPGYPIKAYEDFGAFKLFLHDIGLLGALSLVESKLIAAENKYFVEFKGALAEQYVDQQLRLVVPKKIFYWANQRGQGEIDFLTQDADGNVIPIEVKSGFNLQAKSLQFYIKKYEPKYAIRTSLANFKRSADGKVIDIPLYAIESLKDLLG
jgi:predicted AAA+ superfamily ATPase